MEKVSVEVRKGAARFGVTVRAASVQRAVSLVAGRYLGGDVRVKDHATSAARLGFERPDAVAA